MERGVRRSGLDGSLKPRVVVSRCLGFAACRYNGQVLPCRTVQQLEPFVEFLPVCPEMEIGLGVPRNPVRVVVRDGRRRLVQQIAERDVTAHMTRFCDEYLGSLSEIDGFLLKSRSPSCGIKDVKQYARLGKVAPIGRGAGFFGGAVLERFAGLPVEDEGRLKNFQIREGFLTHLFLHARFGQVKRSGAMGALVGFHAENKFLLLAYNQQVMRRLGRIVANHEKKPFDQVVADYEAQLGGAFPRLPTRRSHVNVLEHALGFFSERITARERQFFLGLLRRLRAGRVPLSVPLNVIRSWSVRFQEEYLLGQSLLAPFPEELMDVTDSGKGRPL